MLTCPWRIDTAASFERNVTMLHWWKPLNGLFGRHSQGFESPHIANLILPLVALYAASSYLLLHYFLIS
jgi:hypothetical protein